MTNCVLGVVKLLFALVATTFTGGTGTTPSVVHAFESPQQPPRPQLQRQSQSLLFKKFNFRRGKTQQTRHRTIMMAASLEENDSSYSNYSASWTDLSPDALVAAPCLIEQTLCQPPTITGGQPQLAASVHHAKALLDAWREEQVESETINNRLWHDTEWQRVQYHDCHGTALYGHWIRPKRRHEPNKQESSPSSTVILLFSTAAGPHDLFLLWKATSLVQTLNNSDDDDATTKRDVQVLIADVVSDETGWGWEATTTGRSRYSAARDALLQYTSCNKNEHGATTSLAENDTVQRKRRLLQDRITAALHFVEDTIVNHGRNDNDDDAATATATADATDSEPQEALPQPARPPISLAALGWCLGGQAIAELAVMIKQEQKQWQQQENANAKSKRAPSLTSAIRGMATFHGVFEGLDDSVLELPVNGDSDRGHVGTNAEVLLCHGMKDPFVPPSDVERALSLFQKCGHTTSLLQLKDAKHGFTNPAQEFNTNTGAFGYHQESADKAWRQTLALLRRRLL